MEFLGAMFKGIGDTFTAGKDVNVAQIGERVARENRSLTREQLATDQQLAQLDYLNRAAATEFKNQALLIGAVVVLFTVALIFRKK